MVLVDSLTALRAAVMVVVSCTMWGSAGKHLVCSSESMSVWYELDELYFHYLSVNMSHCYTAMANFTLTYTAIPMFTAVCVGYRAIALYKNETWVEILDLEDPCEDLKLCEAIKGETIHDSLTIRLRPFYIPEGDYVLSATVLITDDLGRELTLNAKVTMHLTNDGRGDVFHHVGVL